jgi:hypothetical protein
LPPRDALEEDAPGTEVVSNDVEIANRDAGHPIPAVRREDANVRDRVPPARDRDVARVDDDACPGQAAPEGVQAGIGDRLQITLCVPFPNIGVVDSRLLDDPDRHRPCVVDDPEGIDCLDREFEYARLVRLHGELGLTGRPLGPPGERTEGDPIGQTKRRGVDRDVPNTGFVVGRRNVNGNRLPLSGPVL